MIYIKRFFIYCFLIFLFGMVAVFHRVLTENGTDTGILAIVFLISYFGLIYNFASKKGRSKVGWFLSGMFLTPFIGFAIVFLDNLEPKE